MSNNRYSSLNRRTAPSSSLFQDYPGSRPSSSASSRPGYAYPSSQLDGGRPSSSPYLSPYSSTNDTAVHDSTPSFRSATPNSKGQYSTSVLEELEAQNEVTATTILSQKVSQLKSLTIAIGDEIRDSSTLASQINDTFENTGVRLRGTMRRMLRMAERTGVGWKAWVLFFIAVWAIFAYVWLF
ncbi:protein transport protein bet1 [Exophiala dermatitidis]|uniref:Blocked early in transport 1 n=2 Tax=Exophiala dermatitidis TaxID=5970 RepID=H6BV85_EXODN|nr:blocked early in transport 1 [Exophiala dermatitidis NIH/UT8656]KAJ4508650.1 protein transport protein bet1 [Exophiala dermatitidis]EHY54999.1 blocked early in transport 1 [Exophiala dermatitidis NIH/UT8656]KAJ4510902.1 protein transport protein bet1 [Exophiala dermatitidis]KAJ4513298.1 protein transport protein bet1 [Exophiala dermatitidis]KAJ4538151.1 protein transport protein bet1 [Exophiala dermatitidis]